MDIKSLHKPKKNGKLRVAAYARISNDKEVLETSLTEQIRHYTSFILSNPNWEFAGIYPDDGISGTTIKQRKEFMRMIENAKLGLIDIILVKSISRFARNLIDFLQVVRELRNLGIEIYFEDQNVSSLDDKCDETITLVAKFAEESVKSTSENVKWRYQKNYREGKYQFPTNLYGYRVNNRVVRIIEEEAYWVRKIFELYLEGNGSFAIANYLNQKGVASPLGREWHQNTIHKILENEKYVGDAILQKMYVADVLTHKKVRNLGERDMYVIENDHPAIIDRDTWQKAQAMRKARREHYRIRTGHRKVQPEISPLVGFVVCAHCKSNFIVKTNHYYGVNHRVSKFLMCGKNRNSKGCINGNIDYEVFKQGVTMSIKKMKDNIPLLKEMLLKGFGTSDATANKIESLQKEIDLMKSRLEEISDKFDEFSQALKQQLLNELKEKTMEKLKLENDLLVVGTAESRTKEIIKKLNSISSKSEFDIELLTSLVARAYVVDKENVILILGNPDVSKLPSDLRGELKCRVDYRVKCTDFHTDFSVYVNK